MRPAGARQRGQPAPQRPQGASRNEAFENIFGRPAVGHHLGNAPHAGHAPPPSHPPAGYGYGAYPQQALHTTENAYLNPAQPSLPPGHGYAAPPPRTASHSYAQAPGYVPPAPHPGFGSQRGGYEASSSGHSSSGHSRPAPNFGNGNLAAEVSSRRTDSREWLLMDQPVDPYATRDRRASLAPSTYSSHSTASFYSPQPDAVSPPLQQSARVPATAYPSRPIDYSQPPATDRLPVQTNNLAPTQYSSAYDTVSSPASAVFPHRATPSPASGPSGSTTSLNTSSSSARSVSRTSTGNSDSRSPPVSQDYSERLRSPPTDYLDSMSNLSLRPGKGFLDDIPGISGQGESSDLADLAARWSRSDDQPGALDG
jgi:hypothetical protein